MPYTLMRTVDRIRYKKIGEKGNEQLTGKTVSIAGIGGVGATIAAILAREQVDLRLIDSGRVEEQDMHRLALFYDEDITKFKVKQAKLRIAGINPTVQVKSFHEEIAESNLFLLQGECIVDATNNDEINRMTIEFCSKNKLPLVLVRYGGDRANVLVLTKAAPAKTLERASLPGVEAAGIFGPLTTTTGSLAAAQVLKVLLGEKGNHLLEIDGWEPKVKTTKL